jgi:hypothetical protein
LTPAVLALCATRAFAELLLDAVFPEHPVGKWILSVLHPLRLLFASRSTVISGALKIVYLCFSTRKIKKATHSRKTDHSRVGSVRVGGAGNGQRPGARRHSRPRTLAT